MPDDWGYGDQDGPHKWINNYPIAGGPRQSPVDLVSGKAEQLKDVVPVECNYIPENVVDIENTGSSWKVNVQEGDGSCVKGGVLPDKFQLWQYHAHWGSDNTKGSEHTLDGKTFPAELHLVHWNKVKYSSPGEAVNQPDGLAVLGIFLEVGDANAEFDKVIQCLKDIKFKGDKKAITTPIDPVKFLPNDKKSFYTYEGSLTTPPLFECVIWTVFKQPITISQAQLDAMRSLAYCTKDCGDADKHQMVNNYRPPVPLGSRVLQQT